MAPGFAQRLGLALYSQHVRPKQSPPGRGRGSKLSCRTLFVHNRVVVVCIRGEHPEAMAKRLASATATPEHVALAGIIAQLKAGLDALGRHYAEEAAPKAA